MPIKTSYDTFICVSSYIVAGGVMNSILDMTLSYLGSLFTLTTIAVFVFYIKKWLAKEDEKLNKNGGFVSFIKAYLKKGYKNKCIDNETNKEL